MKNVPSVTQFANSSRKIKVPCGLTLTPVLTPMQYFLCKLRWQIKPTDIFMVRRNNTWTQFLLYWEMQWLFILKPRLLSILSFVFPHFLWEIQFCIQAYLLGHPLNAPQTLNWRCPNLINSAPQMNTTYWTFSKARSFPKFHLWFLNSTMSHPETQVHIIWNMLDFLFPTH